MDERQLEQFRSLDWDRIAAKVFNAAIVRAAQYGWSPQSSLPQGKSLEDLVHEAIAEIWDHPERLNPACSISVQLEGIVRSKLWNLSQCVDKKVRRSETLHDEALDPSDELAKVDHRDEFERAMRLLLNHPKVKTNSELELVVMAASYGITDVKEIAAETGLQSTRIYQLTRELRSIYPTIARQLQDGKGAL